MIVAPEGQDASTCTRSIRVRRQGIEVPLVEALPRILRRRLSAKGLMRSDGVVVPLLTAEGARENVEIESPVEAGTKLLTACVGPAPHSRSSTPIRTANLVSCMLGRVADRILLPVLKMARLAAHRVGPDKALLTELGEEVRGACWGWQSPWVVTGDAFESQHNFFRRKEEARAFAARRSPSLVGYAGAVRCGRKR